MKILFAGLGSVGQRHVRNLRGLLGGQLELLAYRSRGLDKVIAPDLSAAADRSIENEFGIKRMPNLESALNERPDAVFVTNPNSLHMPVALAAARAGCHLFIEKPISHTLEGVHDLLRLIAEKKLHCLVSYQLRFHPGFRRVMALLHEGAIGRLLAVRMEFGEYLPNWHKYEDYRQYHAARKDQGGGAILSQIHDIDMCYALFGMPSRVFALGGKLSRLEIDVEDTVSMLLECHSEGRALPVHLQQDYLQQPPSRNFEIVGDAGKIKWDYFGNQVVATRSEAGVSKQYRFDSFQRNQLFLDELKHFLDCLGGRTEPIVSAQDGVNSLRIALAAKRSLESGHVVMLEEDRPQAVRG